jgi:transforming growth factor-beta-induced protein
MTNLRLSTILIVSLGLTVGCAADDESTTTETTSTETTSTSTTGTSTQTEMGSIVDVAASAGSFNTLLAAVDAAGLTATLDKGGPFTVVAPTDAAFDALPEGTVEALLNDLPTLTDILLYHVVDGKVPASDVVNASLVATLQGSDFKVTLEGDSVYINDAMVTTTDIQADNGIIHVLDAVILPPGSITDIVADNPDIDGDGVGDFSTIAAALSAASLLDTLSAKGSLTVFAPTDAAFAKLPAGTVEALLADIPALTNILTYHVAGEKLAEADVVGMSSIEMLNGESADVVVGADGVTVGGAAVIATDIPASNGVVHIVGDVMLP